MDQPFHQRFVFVFGNFKLDVRTGELRRKGTKIRLQGQSFQVLALLLERAGEVVTREELQRKLWAADTFVDFDNGLNIAVKKLRTALSDDAETPLYIETLPRRGYRFLADVTVESAKPVSASTPRRAPLVLVPKQEEAIASVSVVEVEPEAQLVSGTVPEVTAAATPAVQMATPRGRLRVTWVVSLVTLVIATGVYIYLHRPPLLTEKDTIVLADFTNSTGDQVFDGALRQGLEVQLGQSPFLNILSDRAVAQTLTMMRQPSSKDSRLTPELAREVCQRTQSAATLEGMISSLGSQYVLGLKAVNCRSGDVLAEEQVTASNKEQVLKALSEATSKMRLKLGESLPSLRKYDVPLDSATTSSLEALQAFTLGFQAKEQGDFAAAVPHFQRAIGLDPNFAMAYAALGQVDSTMGEASQAAENVTKAYELRERVSEGERFYIDSHYHINVTGNMEKARQALEVSAQTYPRALGPQINLSYVYGVLGDHDKGHLASLEAFKLNPEARVIYANLVADDLNLGRLSEAKATAQEALAKKLEHPGLHLLLYRVAFLEGDSAAMAREAASLMGKPGWEDKMLFYESQTAAYYGQLAKSRGLTKRAVEAAHREDQKEAAAAYEAEAAVREALAGNTAEAKQWAESALKSSNGKDVTALTAIALARSGEVAKAGRLASDLANRFPEDTVVQFDYLPMIRAYIELNSGHASNAIAALEPATPYELGRAFPALNFNLYPTYVRGEAYLAAHQGEAAAAEFQKLFDHAGLVVNELIGALARLGMARAYVQQGDTSKAKAAYQDFLALWKDADPGIPILQKAKAEYVKLQ